MHAKTATHLTQEYWDKLLSENITLKGVGWPNWPESYNLILYKKYLKGFERVIQDLHSKYSISLNSDISVFEAGPGTGFYTNFFYQAGVEKYLGMDISEVSIRKLKTKFPKFKFIRKDISDQNEQITSLKSQYDLVCIVDVLLHITEDSKFRSAVNNLCWILKPGGFLIIGDPITVYRKRSYSEGTAYTHDVSRHIDYVKSIFGKFDVDLIGVYHRQNFLLNKNFDFKHPAFEAIFKVFFFFLNAGLTVFKNSNLIGYLIGYPLSFLDLIITQFQKYSKNSKFLLMQKRS